MAPEQPEEIVGPVGVKCAALAVDGREQVFRQDDGEIHLVTRDGARDSKPATTLGNSAPIPLCNIV